MQFNTQFFYSLYYKVGHCLNFMSAENPPAIHKFSPKGHIHNWCESGKEYNNVFSWRTTEYTTFMSEHKNNNIGSRIWHLSGALVPG